MNCGVAKHFRELHRINMTDCLRRRAAFPLAGAGPPTTTATAGIFLFSVSLFFSLFTFSSFHEFPPNFWGVRGTINSSIEQFQQANELIATPTRWLIPG